VTAKARARWIWLGLLMLVGIPAAMLAAEALQFWQVLGRMH